MVNTLGIKSFGINTVGKDYIVGDIHGSFSLLMDRLVKIGFDRRTDRLFSTGDLVDRGLESELCLFWLAKPWFHAVRGNHEQMAIDYFRKNGDYIMTTNDYNRNGGEWFTTKDVDAQLQFVEAFEKMPVLIELETKAGMVGIVHAEVVDNDWASTKVEVLKNSNLAFQATLWERSRFNYNDLTNVKGVRAVVVGHTPLKAPRVLGNVHYIDTGAVFGNRFTILDSVTLQEV